MELKDKILKKFEGKVVRKDLTSRVKGNAVVPAYVLEYLLGQYCAIDDEEIINKGIEKVKTVISENFVHKAEAEYVKSTIRERKQHKIIDKISVILNERLDRYEATFSNLGIKNVHIADRFVKQHKKLLSGGGVWCILTMGYDDSEEAVSRWMIDAVKPIQVSGVNTEEYIEKRDLFTTEEWLDFLMHSIGFNPEHFNRRGKLIQLSRLIPHVENNFNYIELGPKGTGKSHVFSELSPHGVLVSGGDVSSARLFVSNVGKGQVGLVGYWDVVCLDEFEQVKGSRRADGDLVNIMQNYMANKTFNRGKETVQAYASMAFVGNTKRSVPYMLKNSHLFESIPEAYIKGAFLDRIHLYIPGWEVPILKESLFSNEYGFIVDYLAEILREFRKTDHSDKLDDFADMHPSWSGRDKVAVGKTFSGLVKLVYPHGKITEEEMTELIEFAIEGRRRVKDQLYILDEVFRDSPVTFSYTKKSDQEEIEVETLERTNFKNLRKVQEKEETESEDNDKKRPEPQAKAITIRDNQTGVSYKNLFEDYLRDSKKIILTDAYIRLPYQFRNLHEFCVMLSEIKKIEEEIDLHVITWNSEEFMEESQNNFEELYDSVKELGINLSWEFNNVHARSIVTDHGWKIIPDRGLDIFEAGTGKFDAGNILQERRKCKNSEIIFMKG